MSATYHVVPYKKKWAVKKEGDSHVTSVYKSKSDAIDAAKELSPDFVVHGPTGQAFRNVAPCRDGSQEKIRSAVRGTLHSAPSYHWMKGSSAKTSTKSTKKSTENSAPVRFGSREKIRSAGVAKDKRASKKTGSKKPLRTRG